MTMVNAPHTLMTNINQDELLDISIERVKKVPSPLLVIGLGGTGVNAVNTIKRVFAQRYVLPQTSDGQFIPVPSHTAYLGIDTDANSQGELSSHEYLNITYPDIAHILDPQFRNNLLTADEHAWVHQALNAAGDGIGAGGNRQAARLMLSRNYQQVYSAIRSALASILGREHGDGEPLQRLEIVIVTGVCGGTGAGIFLDVPQIIRHCLKNEAGLASHRDKYQITGYIVMPDVSLRDVMDTTIQRRLKSNGYASLKELDFWMGVGEHQTPYAMKYYGGPSIDWTMPPYDKCILVSGGSTTTVYNDASEVVRNIIAENLLHYLADEEPSFTANGVKQYTYISHEDNIKNDIAFMHKPLPVNYRYRAISAYTKRIPKRKVLYYEGHLLFDTFMPMRDQHGNLAPNSALLQAGKAKEHALKIVGTVEDLYRNFCQTLNLPAICNVLSTDKAKLEAMRQMNPAPHDRYNIGTTPWITAVVQPQALQSANDYLTMAWERFLSFAQKVINDPQQGPFSLLQYLETQNGGLMPALREQVQSWDAYANNFSNDRNAKRNACLSSWKTFLNPPLLSARKAVEAYLENLKNYYGIMRKHAFMDAYAHASHVLLQRIEEFISDALAPMCRDLDKLQKRFSDPSVVTERDAADLVDMSQLTGNIDQVFSETNQNGQITQDFLKSLYASVAKTEVSADTSSSGVAFTYKHRGMDNVLMEMHKTLSDNCPAINGQSLDALMEQVVGPGIAEQNNYMDQLANSFMTGAEPLLIMDPSAPHMTFSYLSIPDDSPKHFARYSQTLGNHVQPKKSSLRDHIYCLTAWDGLPMHCYSLMSDLESTYYACLSDVTQSMRLHLVWDGNPNGDYTRNWCKLPTPSPYYFFSATSNPLCVNEWNAVKALTDRAIACGQIVINDSVSAPTFTIRTFWVDAHRTVAALSDTIRQRVQEITEMKVYPATGTAPTPDERLAMYQSYLGEAADTAFTPGRDASCMAAHLGLERAPIAPWDPAVAQNGALRQVALDNHRKLSQALSAAVLAANPRMQLIVSQQLEGFEALHNAMSEIANRRNVWAPRIAYADAFAKCMVYKLVSFGASNVFYTNDVGEKAPLIQENLLSKDLVGESSPLVRTAAYLADLPEANPVRKYLEHVVRLHDAELDQQETQGLLTKDAYQGMVNDLNALITIADNQLKLKRAALTSMNADTDTIGKTMELINAFRSFLSNRRDAYLFAMQMMI